MVPGRDSCKYKGTEVGIQLVYLRNKEARSGERKGDSGRRWVGEAVWGRDLIEPCRPW